VSNEKELELKTLMRKDPIGMSTALSSVRPLMPLEQQIYQLIKDGEAWDTSSLLEKMAGHGRTVIGSRLKALWDLGYLKRSPDKRKPRGFIYVTNTDTN
jgi:hypothetical protein